MKKDEFEKEMKRLINEYDAKKNVYGPERTNAIFKALSWMHIKRFSQIIDRVFMSERYPPMAKELMRISEELRIDEHEKVKRENKVERNPMNATDPEKLGPLSDNILNMLKRRSTNVLP